MNSKLFLQTFHVLTDIFQLIMNQTDAIFQLATIYKKIILLYLFYYIFYGITLIKFLMI